MVAKKAYKFPKPKRNPQCKICIGFDISPSSIAGCAKSYDPVTDKTFGPVWTVTRWNKEDHAQWDKLRLLSKAEEFIWELQNELGAGGVVREIDNISIGVEEEPARVMNSQSYREQAELVGAFVGSLLSWGYKNVLSVNVKSWQALIAYDLDMKVNKDFNKWTVAEWVEEVYGKKKWPDLIRTAKGLIPRPKTSKAKAAQPDDRYDSTGIMNYVWELAMR